MKTTTIGKALFRIFMCVFIYSLCLFYSEPFSPSMTYAASPISFHGTSQELQKVINTTDSETVIEITGDITFTSTVIIKEGQNITIQSAPDHQYILTTTLSNGRHFSVRRDGTNPGTLTLRNIILDGSDKGGGVSVGTKSHTPTQNFLGGVLYLNEGATIQNCVNRDAFEGGGLSVCNEGNAVVNSGVIKNNQKNMTNGGGGVYVMDSSFTMNDGAINGNKALGSSTSNYPGGGISFYNSSVVINGGEICDNEATERGGGINAGSGALIIKGGIISENRVATASPYHGGGIYVASASLTMTDGTISDNTAKGSGGGIYIKETSNSISISNSKINGNKASSGGGLYVYGLPLVINLCEINGNTATSYGGGIYSNNTLDVNNSVISGNITSSNGGGIYITNHNNLTTTAVTFSDNKASVGYKWTLDETSINATVKTSSSTHLKNINETTYTTPFKNAYNNYDVNFSSISGQTTSYYMVTFDPNYETGIPSFMTLPSGSLMIDPPHVGRPGYTFAGWYKDQECTTPWHFETGIVNSNLTLYAKWIPKIIYVTTHTYEEFPVGSGAWREIDVSIYDPAESRTSISWGTFYAGTAPQVTGYSLIIPERPETVSSIGFVNESQNHLKFYYQLQGINPGPVSPPEVPPGIPSEIFPESPSENPPAPPDLLPGFPADSPPGLPPGYVSMPQEDGTYKVIDYNNTLIGTWTRDANGRWVYNGIYPIMPPSYQIVPQEDGSFETVDEHDTPVGLWNRGEDDNWFYENYQNKWLIPFMTLLLAGLGAWFIIFTLGRRPVTRQEFVRITVRAIHPADSERAVVPYTDVPKESKYYHDIMVAKSGNILTRFPDNRFMPDKAITREEIASVLAGALRYTGVQSNAGGIGLSITLTDYNEIGELFLDDISLVLQLGIMSGGSDGRFDPKGLCFKKHAKRITKNLLTVLN